MTEPKRLNEAEAIDLLAETIAAHLTVLRLLDRAEQGRAPDALGLDGSMDAYQAEITKMARDQLTGAAPGPARARRAHRFPAQAARDPRARRARPAT